MTQLQLTRKALALPLNQRAKLAEKLWDSMEHDLPDDDEDTRAALALADRRMEDLRSGKVRALTREQVMERGRRRLK